MTEPRAVAEALRDDGETLYDRALAQLLDDVRRIADGLEGMQELAIRATTPPPAAAAVADSAPLLTWAAQLVRIVCAHPDDEMAERVRAVAFEMRRAHETPRVRHEP